MAITQTEKKFKKLDQGAGAWNFSSESLSQQLIYPTDLGITADHPGLVVVFELNRLVSSEKRKYEKMLNTPSGDRLKTSTFYGEENAEVSMYKYGSGGIRQAMKKAANNLGGDYVKTDMTIVLPPPDQWSDSNVVNWTTTDLGVIGRAEDFLSSVGGMEGKAAMSQLANSLPGVLSKGVEALGGPSIENFSTILTGKKKNSYTEVMFQNVNNRFFPFQYTFTPRNAEEAEVVRQIIHRFRWAALPELFDGGDKDNQSFFRAPWTFDIHFVSLDSNGKESRWWPKIATCALTNISVNRTPHGEFSVIKDGDDHIPTSIILELQFQEMIVLTKDHLEDPDSSF